MGRDDGCFDDLGDVMTSHELANWLLAQVDCRVMVPDISVGGLVDVEPILYGPEEMTDEPGSEFIVIESATGRVDL